MKEGKEKKAATVAEKKVEKAKASTSTGRGATTGRLQSKQQAKGAPSKVTGKSR